MNRVATLLVATFLIAGLAGLSGCGRRPTPQRLPEGYQDPARTPVAAPLDGNDGGSDTDETLN